MAQFLLFVTPASTLLDQERYRSLDVGEQEPAAGEAPRRNLPLTHSGARTVRARAVLERSLCDRPPHRPPRRLPPMKGVRMMPSSPRPHLRRRPQGLYVYGRSLRGGPHGVRHWQVWRFSGMVPLLLGGLLLLGATVLRPPMISPGEHSPIPQAVHATPGDPRAGGHAAACAAPDRPMRKSWSAFYQGGAGGARQAACRRHWAVSD